jgi:hypothetical protein
MLMSNTYIASHYIATSELADAASRHFQKVKNARHNSKATVAAVQRESEPPNDLASTMANTIAALTLDVATLRRASSRRHDKKDKESVVAVTNPEPWQTPANEKGKGGDRRDNTGRGRGYGGGTPSVGFAPQQSLPGLPSPAQRTQYRYSDRSRKCAHPAGSIGNPGEEEWTPNSWEAGVYVDFDEYERLGNYTELGPLLAQSRPSDHSMKMHRSGRPRTDTGRRGGTWSNETGCAYCAFRPVAPPGTPEKDQWYYGTNNGGHSPYNCQPYVRFLAEGGGSDALDKHKCFLQAMLRKRYDRQ